MSKVNWEKLREVVKNTDKTVLTKVVQSVDGHTIYAPNHFAEAGLNQKVVDAFTKVLKSGDGKEAIYDNNGNAVESLKGVYGLQVLEFIASVFGVSSWKIGRGSRASHLSEQLVESFTK